MKKLFVSSTFKDMQLERDSLQKHIIPNLNMRLRDYGTKITQTDLRWGISTSQLSAEQGEQKVLNVCLEEINKSRPYMIVMIGERYGWVPSPAIIDMNARGRGIVLDNNEISVTQLEIEYIAFTEKWDESRIFFYFRDFDYGDMDAEQRLIYGSESEEAREKLCALKERIIKKFPSQIRHYSLSYKNGEICGIDSFEELVTNDLYSLFLRDVKEDEKIDINERVQIKLHNEAEQAFPIYLSKCDIADTKSPRLAIDDISILEKTHTYIAGSPRSGKSLSVIANYMGIYAYQHKNEPCWSVAEPLFAPPPSSLYKGEIFCNLPKLIDMENTYPLYLQLGDCLDINTCTDLWRSTLYFLNKHLGINEEIPKDKDSILNALVKSLKALKESDKCFYLFIDDLSPEALDDLFTIEHSLDKEEIPKVLEHFLFFISFNNQFAQVPVYVPFYNYSDCNVFNDGEIYAPAEYFFAYAKKLGKEISHGVVDYINGYYGGYGLTYEDAELTHITRPHANLMANYFLNFTANDYEKIKQNGNDMNAIEAQNLALLRAVKGNFSDDMNGTSLKRVALLNIEKFEANHEESTLKMLGIIYLLSGVSFSMDEARQIFEYFGEEWSDLEFISYFDDFKEFFVYNKANDSYRVLPVFHSMLRSRFIEKYLPSAAEATEAVQRLILAVQACPSYNGSLTELFYTVLLVYDTDFVLSCLKQLKNAGSDEYTFARALGNAAGELLNTLTKDEAYKMGKTLLPILAEHFTCDAICGFFVGFGQGFQNHDYEKKVMELCRALSDNDISINDEVTASLSLGITLLKVECYMGWKNNKALSFLCEAEPYLHFASSDLKIRYLSLCSAMLRRFNKDTPVCNSLCDIIRKHLPSMRELSYNSEREISVCADLFTVSFFVKSYGIAENYYEPEALLAPFLKRDKFHLLGLRNIDAAIYSQNATVIGMDELINRTAMFMESLSVYFPSSRFAYRLVGSAMLSRMFFVPDVFPKEEQAGELEKHFYPYRRAVLRSTDRSAYHFINYALFLQNARYFHIVTGITHSMDEMMWEATNMGDWTTYFDKTGEESIDVLIAVSFIYVAYLRDPKFHDMISTDSYTDSKFRSDEEGEPSLMVQHYRLTKLLCAVLHNPSSLIMKPRLKKLYQTLVDHYGDYIPSLSGAQRRMVNKYITEL